MRSQPAFGRLKRKPRRQYRDQNGSEPWACENCDCTERLERRLATLGDSFLAKLQARLAKDARDDFISRKFERQSSIGVRHGSNER
jgi:hypothetical protein